MQVKSTTEQFEQSLRGRLIHPEDPDYDRVRKVWNGMIDRRPSMIVQCQGASDVVKSVNFARENNLLVSVKGGGHNVAGKAVCENGMMIDLSLMNAIWVEPEKQIAHVGPGATLGDFDQETQSFGLATTVGIVSKTGIAGLTLGGGLGYLARRFGLAIDNLISADVVTANGKLIRASEDENADLFWGLRGGGGNFGIVTSFEFQLHEVGPDILSAQIFYPIEKTKQVLQAYRKLMMDAPDELSGYIFALNIPPVSPFPAAYHGKPAIALLACHSGNMEKGKKRLSTLQKIGKPILEAITPMPYVALQQNFDAGSPEGARYYWKSYFMNELSDKAIDTFIRFTNHLPGPLTLAGFEPMGGAIGRIAPDATAFPDRDAKFAFGVWAGWDDENNDDEIIAWTREFHKAMKPFSNGSMYTNYLDRDDDFRVKPIYGENYKRLQKIKAKYDPDNFFRLNQNVVPKSG